MGMRLPPDVEAKLLAAAGGDEPAAARRKYRNQPVVVDGIRFDSKAEAHRWGELRFLEQSGAIFGLRRQVPFEMVVNGVKVCTYVCDFLYEQGGEPVVEDVKGVVTPEFKLKKKLMKACHGIDVLVTGRRK